MIWYETGVAGYRINHRGEVLSVKGEDPMILKPRRCASGPTVTLRQDGRYVTYRVYDLMALAGLQVPHAAIEVRLHPEAARTHCDQGHLFTAENTMRRKGARGDIRKCRQCHNLAMARYRAKKKAAARATEPDCRARSRPSH